MNLNPVHGEVYSMQHYVIKFVWLPTDQWFSASIPVSSINKTDTPQYNWNIVESGIEHHKTLTNFVDIIIIIITSKWYAEILSTLSVRVLDSYLVYGTRHYVQIIKKNAWVGLMTFWECLIFDWMIKINPGNCNLVLWCYIFSLISIVVYKLIVRCSLIS